MLKFNFPLGYNLQFYLVTTLWFMFFALSPHAYVYGGESTGCLFMPMGISVISDVLAKLVTFAADFVETV